MRLSYQITKMRDISVMCVGPVRKPHCWISHDAAQIKKKVMSLLRCGIILSRLVGKPTI